MVKQSREGLLLSVDISPIGVTITLACIRVPAGAPSFEIPTPHSQHLAILLLSNISHTTSEGQAMALPRGGCVHVADAAAQEGGLRPDIVEVRPSARGGVGGRG